MKTLLLFGLLFAASAQAATNYVIGLTPFLDTAVKDDYYRRIVGVIIERLPQKSSLALYDAYNLTNIARLEVPDLRAFQSGKTRANQFREQIGHLKRFLAAEHARPVGTKLNFDRAVRLPQFLEFLSQNNTSTNAMVLLVIGSPLYVDHKEPGFSMLDGYFPSDGHLLATRDRSLFSLQSRGEALVNTAVHFGYIGDPWLSAIHRDKIARFWTLYVDGQGGRLASFVGDPATLFDAAFSNAPIRASGYELDRAQTKVEMLRVTRDVAASDWITRETLSGPRPAPPQSRTGPMKIGIRWRGEIDLDLYARANADADMLFFENTRAAEGYYFKDHRSSPNREYEYIEFEAAVDVHRVEAEINFYKGEAPNGPAGEVRIEFEGRIYSGQFEIAATHGNKGRSGNSQRKYWARIDVPGILGLARADR